MFFLFTKSEKKTSYFWCMIYICVSNFGKQILHWFLNLKSYTQTKLGGKKPLFTCYCNASFLLFCCLGRVNFTVILSLNASPFHSPNVPECSWQRTFVEHFTTSLICLKVFSIFQILPRLQVQLLNNLSDRGCFKQEAWYLFTAFPCFALFSLDPSLLNVMLNLKDTSSHNPTKWVLWHFVFFKPITW